MDDPIIESPKVDDEEEDSTVNEEVREPEIVIAGPTSSTPPPLPPAIDYEARKLARDAKAKRKDEKTVQQVLKTLNNLKTPEEKLSAMCKKYSELLHENRQLQGTAKQSEKNIMMIHREKEQFRHERSKAVLAKTRMEQLCRELQKLNKAQQEETALKLKVEEEKRKEICLTFQSAFAEMNTLTNQNNEKSAKMREENLEMREKIKCVRERIELTETQLDKVRQQAKLELELAREKLVRVTLELTAEKEALMKDKSQLLMKLAKYHVRVKEHEGTEQFLRKQIKIYEEKFEEFKKDVNKTTESLKNFRPESREMKKKMLKVEKETALWKQRWEKTNAAVIQMTEIKEKRDAEMLTLNNKLSTLQELCKVFQRERTSLMAQLREKNNDGQTQCDCNSRKSVPQNSEENRESVKHMETITKDCEKLKDNLSKLEGSLSEAVREAFNATVYENDNSVETSKSNQKKSNKKTKKSDSRNRTNQNTDDDNHDDRKILCSNDVAKTSDEPIANDESELSRSTEYDNVDNCAAEIAILERHETVLKDIAKVIGEQTILQSNALNCDEIIEKSNSKSEASSCEEIMEKCETESSVPNSIALSDDKSCDNDNSTDNRPNNVDSEDKTPTDNDNGISITEFEIVHHGSCVPDNEILPTHVDDDLSIVDQPKLTPIDDTITDIHNSIETLKMHDNEVTEKNSSSDLSEYLIENTNSSVLPIDNSETGKEKVIVD